MNRFRRMTPDLCPPALAPTVPTMPSVVLPVAERRRSSAALSLPDRSENADGHPGTSPDDHRTRRHARPGAKPASRPPRRVPRAPPAPSAPAAPPAEVYYENCDAARAAGAAPLSRGPAGLPAGSRPGRRRDRPASTAQGQPTGPEWQLARGSISACFGFPVGTGPCCRNSPAASLRGRADRSGLTRLRGLHGTGTGSVVIME